MKSGDGHADTSTPRCGATAFAQIVEGVAVRARAMGLAVPSFRSPPPPGRVRTMRRNPDGSITVSIALGRPTAAVLADVVEGVVVAAGLSGADGDRVRACLLGEALEPLIAFAPAA